MIALIRQLILCVTAASLFGAVSLALVKDSALKEVIRLGVGLVLILSVVLPLQHLFSFKLPDFFGKQTNIQQEEPVQVYQDAVLEQVEIQTQQYIVQLAGTYHIDCTAQVTAQIAEDGTVSIDTIQIQTKQTISKEQEYALRKQLIQELGAKEIHIMAE